MGSADGTHDLGLGSGEPMTSGRMPRGGESARAVGPQDVDDQPRVVAREPAGERLVEGELGGEDPPGASAALERIPDEDVVDALAVHVERRRDRVGPPVLRVAGTVAGDPPGVLVEGRAAVEPGQGAEEADPVA